MAYPFLLAHGIARFRAAACSVLALTVLACNPENTVEPVAEPEAGHAGVQLKTAAAARSRGIAYGDFHLEEPDFRSYSGTLRAISPTSARAVLEKARSAGVRVFVALAVAKNLSADSKGRFDFAKWKKTVDRFRSVDLQPYIADGTIVGHYIIDEPQCKTCWGGAGIPAEAVEEMARYSKAIWPNLATGVRMVPSRFPDIRHKHIDFGWAQWEGPLHVPSFGDTPERFRDREIAAAKKRGIGVVFGLNYINGGDGSSGILGTYENARKVKRFAMSTAEVKRVGAVLAAAPYACALISWKSDAKFDARPGMMAAKEHVGSVAANRETGSCAPNLSPGTPPPVEEPPSDPEPPADSVPETPTDPVPEPPTDTAPEPPAEPEQPPVDPAPSGGGNRAGIAFGDYLLGEGRFASPYTGAFRVLSPTSARPFLDKARAAGVRVVITMAASKQQAAGSRGVFDLAKWKKEIDRYRGIDLGSYIADGTIAGHYLVSGPHCTSCWGGTALSAATLEEMARYSKSIWPAMATGIGAPPSRTPNVRYQGVDFAWAQWEGPLHIPSNGMTPERFRDVEISAAQQRGLKVVFGLNYLDGGDGSSRIAGTYKNATSKKVNRWQMSAEEVRRVGAVFAAAPYACAVLNRNTTAGFDSRPGMMEAKQYVANIAQNRPQESCAR